MQINSVPPKISMHIDYGLFTCVDDIYVMKWMICLFEDKEKLIHVLIIQTHFLKHVISSADQNKNGTISN